MSTNFIIKQPQTVRVPMQRCILTDIGDNEIVCVKAPLCTAIVVIDRDEVGEIQGPYHEGCTAAGCYDVEMSINVMEPDQEVFLCMGSCTFPNSFPTVRWAKIGLGYICPDESIDCPEEDLERGELVSESLTHPFMDPPVDPLEPGYPYYEPINGTHMHYYNVTPGCYIFASVISLSADTIGHTFTITVLPNFDIIIVEFDSVDALDNTTGLISQDGSSLVLARIADNPDQHGNPQGTSHFVVFFQYNGSATSPEAPPGATFATITTTYVDGGGSAGGS